MGAILFFVGLLVGVCATILICKQPKLPKPSGTFVMDFTDPMKDICRLELAEDLDSIYQKKQIVLEVKALGTESQN